MTTPPQATPEDVQKALGFLHGVIAKAHGLFEQALAEVERVLPASAVNEALTAGAADVRRVAEGVNAPETPGGPAAA